MPKLAYTRRKREPDRSERKEIPYLKPQIFDLRLRSQAVHRKDVLHKAVESSLFNIQMTPTNCCEARPRELTHQLTTQTSWGRDGAVVKKEPVARESGMPNYQLR